MPDYLTSKLFAEFYGISERKSRKALNNYYIGKTWRGLYLPVIKVPVSGAPGGIGYAIEVDRLTVSQRVAIGLTRSKNLEDLGNAEHLGDTSSSLPRAEVLAIDQTDTRMTRAPIAADCDWQLRYSVLLPILPTQPSSRERSSAVTIAAAKEYRTAEGERRFTERTIYRWLAAYDAKGIAGLKVKVRADRHKARVLISRAWDALDLPRAEQERIAAELVTFVRSLWADATVHAGWKVTASHASAELRRLTADALGIDVAEVAKAACAVTRPFVEREMEYRSVGIYDRDRKQHEDRTRPRISRTLPERPMQIVMGDVHPLDIYYVRDDGSNATAKLIAWLDVGTGRVRLVPAFFEKGKGVIQAHVIRAFIGMVLDPRWGMPEGLYLDNGSEYQWDRFINDAANLAGMTIRLDGMESTARQHATIRAQAYNAAAKGVLEGAFHQLESRFFSLIPGWIGGDRLKTKAANVGKAPVTFPGTKDELVQHIQNVETAFNDTAQAGRLGGQSPNARFAALVNAGWTRTDMAEGALYAAFCEREPRTIRQGRIRHDKQDYYHDRLAELPAGACVSIGIPKWGETGRISVWDERDQLLCIAAIDVAYAHDDEAGAIEAGRRRGLATDAVKLRKSRTRPIDGPKLLEQQAASADPLPIPARGAIISLSEHQTAAGTALKTARSLAIDRKQQKQSEDRERQRLALQKLVAAGG